MADAPTLDHADVERIRALLKDPVAVHLNMLHGHIAKIEMGMLAHVHGQAMQDRWAAFERWEAAQATPSPPVAAPPATAALSDEQIGAICDQFKTLIRQKREVHIRRGLDAGADYYIGDVANYVGHAVKEAANARIAELAAENEMLSRSLDESLFCNVQGIAENLAAQPQPQPAQPLTDKDLGAEIERLTALKKERATAFFEARIGLPCSQCGDGKYQADGNGYSQFHRCDKCHHVPMWNGDSEWLAPGITAPSTPTPPGAPE